MEEETEGNLSLEEKIQELVSNYKIPLIFAILAVFLIILTLVVWQSNKESARIIFTQENEADFGASISAQIKVDIEGAIVNPGVYELSSGSRIQDLLIMAGGLAGQADRDWISKNINLAAKLTDGGKIYFPKIGEAAFNSTVLGDGKTTTVNINHASLSELDKLSGVGPATAQKIIDGRPYQTTEDLINRKIINKSTFEKIKNKISLY